MIENIRRLLNIYREISSAAGAFEAAPPNTIEWLRARDRLRNARRLIDSHEAELAPPGSLYYQGRESNA